ncbi:hypothetical protein HDU99_003660 [Rhizoclosmatium hyalinum]|nr:hypothetical protein HDU99_003660 [Rhizoclosmatium hyalinum]
MPVARKFFLSQLYQSSLAESTASDGGSEFLFAGFSFSRIWIQGTVTAITSSSFHLDDASAPSFPSEALPPTAGLIRVDIPDLNRLFPFVKLGAEVAVIGRVVYDYEGETFAITGLDTRVLDKSNDVNASSKWAIEVCGIHERVYYPIPNK